jgi:dipeptidase E
MKLLLTSAGISNKSIVDALLSLTKKPFVKLHLAIIPTALNIEDGGKEWFIDDLVNCQKLGLKSIDIVDISALPKDVWFPRLKQADILFFEGGNTFYLMYWLKKSGLDKLLPKLLETKVYIGVSAGSMVACKHLGLSTSKRLYDEGVEENCEDEGLNFVDFLIMPHLNSPYFTNVRLDKLKKIADEIGETFYAIDDDTAIKIDDEKMEIISEGEWKKFN